jgi:hypothetical protein
MMNTALVIPSNREECLEKFMKEWDGKGDWDQMIVIEDGPEKTFKCVPGNGEHFSWRQVSDFLRENAWIISRRDSAIRCFGLWWAWKQGCTSVMTLDDDCFPYHERLCAAHMHVMNNVNAWSDLVPGMRTRGMPYSDVGILEDVVANIGLWTGVPDIDAITALRSMSLKAASIYMPPSGTRVLPAAQYHPISGMNLMVKRQAIPLFYYPLQGEGYSYRRFDDIWAGIIAQACCRRLGWSITAGEPFVYHSRASDPFENLVKEAPGVKMNEMFWRSIDREITKVIGCDDPISLIDALGFRLASSPDEYIAKVGKALRVWSTLFRE